MVSQNGSMTEATTTLTRADPEGLDSGTEAVFTLLSFTLFIVMGPSVSRAGVS